jgi:hypothetical protein
MEKKHYKACRKDDREAKTVAAGESSTDVLDNASKITGLSKDTF